jgi:hypothetical protein
VRLGGFSLIEADDMDAALGIARGYPAALSVRLIATAYRPG